MTGEIPRRTGFGLCPLCERETFLTFHHLIPKKMHRRTFFKKHYSKSELAAGINICRQCHIGLHKRFSEMELAKRLNNLSAIQNQPALMDYFKWVSKQKVQ